jgi:predicted alpha/beta-hydrolase family hydrolase
MSETPFDSPAVAGILHQPDNPNNHGIALTHGAGSNCNAPLLAALAREFAAAGYLVLRYDLPFRRERTKGPPFPAQAARDREGVAEAIAALRSLASGRIIAGGHSYGGRQTAMRAAEQPNLCDGLLLFSYPLHPPAKPDQKRTAFFPDLRTPALFVHGTDDPFGTAGEMCAALPLIPAPTELLFVERSGHELKHAKTLFPQIKAWLSGQTV